MTAPTQCACGTCPGCKLYRSLLHAERDLVERLKDGERTVQEAMRQALYLQMRACEAFHSACTAAGIYSDRWKVLIDDPRLPYALIGLNNAVLGRFWIEVNGETQRVRGLMSIAPHLLEVISWPPARATRH